MIYPKAIINLNSLEKNIRYLKSLTKNKKLIPVVKANAYGHGIIPVVKKLYSLNIDYICVATISEVEKVLLEGIGISILHLGKVCIAKVGVICNQYTVITINSIEDVNAIHKNILPPITIRCHIKVDTGMNRMGCSLSEAESILELVKDYSNINIKGIYSHLDCAE